MNINNKALRRLLFLSPLLTMGGAATFSTIKKNTFDFGEFVIPHPSKVHKGGEDAWYADSNFLAVADGVGGWADHGVDPAIYSRKLCSNIGQWVARVPEKFLKDPRELIKEAAAHNREDGSSTLVVVTLPESGDEIYTAYVGDSGYIILRPQNEQQNKFDLVYESESQTKGFNFPYQLGWGRNGDDPSSALDFKHKIKQNDVVVVGSDGLFDNMSGSDIRTWMERHLAEESWDAKRVARELANATYKLSLDKKYNSPFSIEARKYGYRFDGGKSDDITVVVGKVNLIGDAGAKSDL